uniref:TOX high mobility group box family member 4 a n=1 Tax=Oryzias latipes TaxID=8090 RepID=A0A3B3I1R2_ORYLA
MSGDAGHSFLSAETFHTPSLGDEVFEIPPISLDPDQALSISDAHFELSDGTGVSTGSKSLVSNLVAEANDPSFASTFINSGSHGLEHINLGAVHQAGGTALLSSSELGSSSGSHFSSSSPMTIDVQLADIGPGLLGSSHLTTINPSELALGLCEDNVGRHPEVPEQPLSATPSPAGSLQDEDMNDFRRSVLVEAPMSLSSSPLLSHMSFHPVLPSSAQPAAARRSGGKPAAVAPAPETTTAKKGRKKKDPNEPQKPVSAYALFFRDTQAAIKGQNPNASFGEVSKIVASMWDSLAEDQKQVNICKTIKSLKEENKSLKKTEEMEPAPSPPPAVIPSSHATPPAPGNHTLRPALASNSMDVNHITSVCSSSIILDVPEVTTRSHAGAGTAVPVAPTITKIIIPKHILQGGGQPPPLQQMQNAPPPPRLQQMAPIPPPLQAKPREGGPTPAQPVSVSATPPPPLQIKIVPATIQDRSDVLVHGTATVSASARSEPVPNLAETAGNTDDDVTEVLNECQPNVLAGCNNPAVDSEDWDKEYCSNECVATHCRDVFQAWCSIKNQSVATVK